MKRIAVVDDELEILSLLERLLSRNRDYDVRVFSNPINALEEVKSGGFDLILLDIMMPKMDGMEFLTEVRKSNKKVKVIMMTAHSTLDRVLNAHKTGADDYILKPFKSLPKILERINRVI
jgi:DNA-binding response OmpR family regulator